MWMAPKLTKLIWQVEGIVNLRRFWIYKHNLKNDKIKTKRPTQWYTWPEHQTRIAPPKLCQLSTYTLPQASNDQETNS